MDLGKIEVLDVVRVIRVQDLLRDKKHSVTVRSNRSYHEVTLTCPPVHSAHSIRKT
jgi:hypothetical protein